MISAFGVDHGPIAKADRHKEPLVTERGKRIGTATAAGGGYGTGLYALGRRLPRWKKGTAGLAGLAGGVGTGYLTNEYLKARQSRLPEDRS